MKLPRPRPTYDAQDEAQTRMAIEQADAQTFKRGQDVEIAGGISLVVTQTGALILMDGTGTRYTITVGVGVDGPVVVATKVV